MGLKAAGSYIQRNQQRAPADISELWVPSRKYAVANIGKRWAAFCSYEGQNSDECLRMLDPQIYLGFLQYICDSHAERQPDDPLERSTVRETWKKLRSLYCWRTGVQMPHSIGLQIRGELMNRSNFVIDNGLKLTGKPKPNMYYDDFVLHMAALWRTDNPFHLLHERYRVELWQYAHWGGYTGNRPGSMLLVPEYGTKPVSGSTPPPERPKMVTYRDCRLALVAHDDRSKRPFWILEVTFRYTKGSKGLSKPITYKFHSQPHLITCPILSFLTHAFADQAFGAQGLTRPEHLYSLQVESFLSERVVTWKPSVLDDTVFKNQYGTPLEYNKISTMFHDWGQYTGFEQDLTTYALRRGAANAINQTTTEALRNQALGHDGASTYNKYYMDRNLQFDIQSAFIGVPSPEGLQRLTSRMSRSIDTRVPIKLDENEKVQAWRADTRLAQLIEKRDSHPGASAQRPRQDAEWRFLDGQVTTRKRAVVKRGLKNKKRHFREWVAVDDVERQLQGLPPNVPVSKASVESRLPERHRISLAFSRTWHHEPNSDADIQDRIAVLIDLVALCQLQESRLVACDLTGQVGWPLLEDVSPVVKDDIRETSMPCLEEPAKPIILDDLTCLFCGEQFCAKDSVQRHAQRVHFRGMKPTAHCRCPDLACRAEVFQGVDHLKNHAERVHGCSFGVSEPEKMSRRNRKRSDPFIHSRIA